MPSSPLLALMLALATSIASGSPNPLANGGGACASSAECWYNGACVSSACVCDDVWTGPACNVLLQGVTTQLWPNPSLPLPADELLTDSWGVTTALDAATSRWWLYACVACVFANGSAQPFSMHNSGIIVASAPALEGPYTYEREFEGIFSEGPHITRVPRDGSYVLITPSSNASSKPPVTCTGDYQAARHVAIDPISSGLLINKTSMWHSASPAGPWQQHNFSLNEVGPLSYFSNPSLAIDAMNKAWLAWRVNLVEPVGRGETVGVASAASWDSPLYSTIAEPLSKGLVGIEDPFIWSHDVPGVGQVLSLLVHAQVASTGVGGLFVSADAGQTWQRSPIPAYDTSVPAMTGPGWDGKAFTFLRRERPELLFDASTGKPTHLLTGAMRGGAGPAHKWQLSYSIATRLGKAAAAEVAELRASADTLEA